MAPPPPANRKIYNNSLRNRRHRSPELERYTRNTVLHATPSSLITMNNSSTPVIRPRASSLPGYQITSALSPGNSSSPFDPQFQDNFQFAPSQLLSQAQCCRPGCQNRSRWRSATQLTFRIEELNDDPVLCASCVLRYPNLPPEQCYPIWPPETELLDQMYRIVCRESRAHGFQVLPPYITEKEEIICPRSPFAKPLWRPAIFDGNNRRVYICPHCNKDFRKQSRYIRHVSEHINLFECRHCNQPKARVEDTKNHLIRTCLPRHYPDIRPSRFDGDENDPYHYSKHYRWRTNEEFLTESKRRFPNHDLGPEPAIIISMIEPAVSQSHFIPNLPAYSY